MDRSPFLIPSFVIGVTDPSDPQSEFLEDVRKTVRLLLEFLQEGALADEGAPFEQIKEKLPHRGHAPGLDQWPGLGRGGRAHINWVSLQADFYRRRAKEHAHNRHAIHKVSGVLALCGVWLVSALVLEARWPFLKTHWFEKIVDKTMPWGEAAGLALISFFLILWLWKFIDAVRNADRSAVRKKTSRKAALTKALRKGPTGAFAPALRAFIDGFVPTLPSTVYQPPGARHLRMIVSFVAHLPLAAFLGAAVVALSAAGHEAMGFREAEAPISILSGVFLLTGALMVGWTEKNLLSEQAYQYNAMASLFSAAQTRSVERLSEADAAHARKDIETRDRLIRQTREMFYDLGIEALDENAEWLILHRARPMEPMMA